jgi:hypothetical protein
LKPIQLTFSLDPAGTSLFYYEHDSLWQLDCYDLYGLLLLPFRAAS